MRSCCRCIFLSIKKYTSRSVMSRIRKLTFRTPHSSTSLWTPHELGDSFVHCVSGTNSRSRATNRQQGRRITEVNFGFSHGSPKNCAALFSTGNCNGRALTFSERDIWLPQHRSIKPCALLPRCAMITNLHALRRALQGRSNSDLRMRYSKDSNAIVHGGLGTHFILNKECISRQHSALLF